LLAPTLEPPFVPKPRKETVDAKSL
jgi:hypothetical protein